jgi:hypothetical protein
VRFFRVLVRFFRMFVSLGGMLMRCLVISLFVLGRCFAVRFGCLFVVFSRFLVMFFGHAGPLPFELTRGRAQFHYYGPAGLSSSMNSESFSLLTIDKAVRCFVLFSSAVLISQIFTFACVPSYEEDRPQLHVSS